MYSNNSETRVAGRAEDLKLRQAILTSVVDKNAKLMVYRTKILT